MPTYLCHGFRWPRPLIRIHIILQNLDDAAAEWLMAPATTATLTDNFHTLYPELMPSLSSLRFLEQYDPADMSSKSQPFAYVCDQVHEVQLGVDVDEVRGKGVANEAWGALVDLRDKIAPGEKVAWFVVVNGDVERWAPATVGLLDGSSSAESGGSTMSPLSGSGSSVGREEDGEVRLASQSFNLRQMVFVPQRFVGSIQLTVVCRSSVRGSGNGLGGRRFGSPEGMCSPFPLSC
jgi:hypothetical protein